ncbi:hypothetical protein N431DRAFT_457350 [Stipitochalara longipes BDJ]|nr:hypothetical protein N431DRAFT_457350 [Stipitochalara longipes BDJ]
MDPTSGNAASMPSTSTQSYSADEWEQKRSIITQLYRDENTCLDHVRSILAQQEFRPTAVMLKKRIKKWNLDRNHKQADMLHAVRVALERQSLGKRTAFLIRGRVVSFEEVQRYFRKKGVRDLRVLVKNTNVLVPTTRIECYTPEPSDILKEHEHRHIVDGNIATVAFRDYLCHSSSAVTIVADPNQVMRVLQQPSELNQLDQLIHYGHDYYASIFETRD